MISNTDRLNTALAGRYRIEKHLGAGGMATVYLAHDLKHDRKVAVKVLKPELAAVLGAERFVQEIKTTASLQHPNILPLFDSGTADSFLFYVMPFIEGETLRDKLNRETQLGVDEAVRIAREVADALDYAHRHGVIHRDLKPENVLMYEGRAMLADFGIALAVKEAGGDRLTETGLSLGTPQYMSPEQATGERSVDLRSDVYSLGAVVYEMLSGEPPIGGATAQAIIAKLITERPTALKVVRASVPDVVERAVMKSLSKVPADRFDSAASFSRALTAGPATKTGSGTRNFAIAAVVLIMLAIVSWAIADKTSGGAVSASSGLELAVLPIENVGGDSLKQYLADGLTTELAGELRKTPGLEVVGDLSTQRFKGTRTPPNEIAKQLGVGLLLTGRMQSQGAQIRLQAQLVDADGKLLWSGTFDGDDKNPFALQDQITAAVTGEMRLALTPGDSTTEHRGRTRNPAARDAYFRGQFEKNKLSEQGLRDAVVHFKRAVALDSNYAQAYVGLAFAYDMIADAYADSHEYHMLALDAARRAAQADTLLGEAHVLYGFELAAANWDFARGIAEMERGLALSPKGADGLFMCTIFFAASGDGQKAVELADRLRAIDPLSPAASLARALALVYAGRFAEALREDSATKAMDPNVVYGDAIDGTALRELGKLDESVRAYLAYQKIIQQPAFGLALTYGRMGRRADAAVIARELETIAAKTWYDPTWIALAWLGAGDRTRAMQWLEKGVHDKDFLARILMGWDSAYFRELRDDPQFIALKNRVLATTFKS